MAELRARVAAGQVGQLDTLYLGGGTPSKLGPDGIRWLIDGLREAGVGLAADAEVTMEANPEDVSKEAASAWVRAGVNRLSLGVQSFAPAALAWMHRTHDSAQAAAAVATVRSAGLKNVSIDLIYAIPDRIDRSWKADLARAIDLEPDHLSVYGLTVEPRTPLGKWTARGSEAAQDEDRSADEFLAGHARLVGAGFEHYEVSSYARAGRRSRHNTAYWRRVPYLGLGPSAHSFDGTTRRWNTSALAAWERELAEGLDPLGGQEALTGDQIAAELLYLGLRTDTGAELVGVNLEIARTWVSQGWATLDGALVRLTAEGWLRLDALAGALTA